MISARSRTVKMLRAAQYALEDTNAERRICVKAKLLRVCLRAKKGHGDNRGTQEEEGMVFLRSSNVAKGWLVG